MKPFVFTLQALLNYKETLEKKQKAALSAAQAALRALREKEARVDAASAANARSLEAAVARGVDIAGEMERHHRYFLFLREQKKALQEQIAAAEAEKSRLMAILVGTMKEIKTLTKLRQEQYSDYLEEARREEALAIGDIISYNTAAGEDEAPAVL